MSGVWMYLVGFALGALCEAQWGRRLRAAGERTADRVLKRRRSQAPDGPGPRRNTR